MKRTTMADVARRAQTSTAVVSYVLNPGSRPVSDELRARVLAAVDELDYRRDRNARALRVAQHAWGQIGLVVPDVTLPLYGALVNQVERAGRSRQQLVITATTGFDPALEEEVVRGLVDAGVDALIAVSVTASERFAAIADAARVPLVWAHNSTTPSGHALVGSDHVAAGRMATEHLTDLHARRRLAFVGGFTDADGAVGDRHAVEDRYAGFTAALGGSGRQVRTDLGLAGAYAAVRALLADPTPDGRPVDGLVVGTYGQTAAVLRAIQDAGLRVPEDVAVISFDGDPRNDFGAVVLSTVQQDVDVIARTALDLVLGPPAGRAATSSTPLPVHLHATESCGCPRVEPLRG